jgi:hypothetical protein
MIPSAYMFWNAIEKFNFESQSSIFISEVIKTPETKVLKADFIFEEDSLNYIDLYMIGEVIPDYIIDEWNGLLNEYRLRNTELRVFQDKDIEQQIIAMDDLENNVKTGIIEELYQKNQQALVNKDLQINLLENELAKYKSNEVPLLRIDDEIKSLQPYIRKIALGENYYRNDSNAVDTVYTVLVSYDKKIKNNRAKKIDIRKMLGNWLKIRLNKDTILVVDVN